MADVEMKERTKSTNGLMKKIKKTLKLEPELARRGPCVDYPQEGEQVREGAYSIRISAEDDSEVKVSINNGEWQPCRTSIGYWWFDWQPLGTIPCKLVAHSRVGKGRWKKSDARSCRIVDSNQPLNVGLTFD